MPHPLWPTAPMVLHLLAQRPHTFPTPYLPSRSLLPLLGPRVPAEELYNSDVHDEIDVENLHLVCAHTLRPLIGARLSVTSAADIPAELSRILSTELPAFDWHLPTAPEDWSGPFERYGLVHKSLPAPPHPETGEPMSLEVFGSAESAGVVVISGATYANLQFTGYGADLYL